MPWSSWVQARTDHRLRSHGPPTNSTLQRGVHTVSIPQTLLECHTESPPGVVHSPQHRQQSSPASGIKIFLRWSPKASPIPQPPSWGEYDQGAPSEPAWSRMQVLEVRWGPWWFDCLVFGSGSKLNWNEIQFMATSSVLRRRCAVLFLCWRRFRQRWFLRTSLPEESLSYFSLISPEAIFLP